MDEERHPSLSRTSRVPVQLSWLRPLLFAVGAALLVAGLARVSYLLWFLDRVAETGGFAYILLQGLRFDLVSLGYLLAIPAALTPLLNALPRIAPHWMAVLRAWLLAVVAGFVFMEVVTLPFILEYDIRPNYLFVEYLAYPEEVFSMLFIGYKFEILACIVTVPALTWAANRALKRQVARVVRNRLLLAPLFSFAALLVCFAAARSTLDHRPVNPSTVAFSADTLVNSLPLNSLYSVANAVYELRHEDKGFPYGDVPVDLAVEAVRSDMHLPARSFASDSIYCFAYGNNRIRGIDIFIVAV